jgi:hypothetical protein
MNDTVHKKHKKQCKEEGQDHKLVECPRVILQFFAGLCIIPDGLGQRFRDCKKDRKVTLFTHMSVLVLQ